MAICPKCNKKFSDSVIALHIKRCKNVEELEQRNEIVEDVADLKEELEESDEEIRLKAKELGIKSWHVKSIERLIEEINEVM